MSVWRIIKRLRVLLVGTRLINSKDKHKAAADQLDAALREVFKE